MFVLILKKRIYWFTYKSAKLSKSAYNLNHVCSYYKGDCTNKKKAERMLESRLNCSWFMYHGVMSHFTFSDSLTLNVMDHCFRDAKLFLLHEPLQSLLPALMIVDDECDP